MGTPMQRRARPQVGRPNARPQRKCKAPPHVRKLGAPTQCKARPQDGRPKANERCVRKMGAQTQHKARLQDGRPNEKLICNENVGHPNQRKARPKVGHPNATKGSSARWAPKRNARHVCNARHVDTSANWAPQRNARYVRKMVAQTQNSSATKTYTQGSSRLKDELEDG
jgi:hypothetical protein